MEKDETLADAHGMLAAYYFYAEFDWPKVGERFRRALELNPARSEAYLNYGFFLAAMHRPGDALEQIRKGKELDPLNPVCEAIEAWALLLIGKIDEAITKFETLVGMMRKGKRPTYLTIAIGLLLVVIAGFVGRQSLLEQYWLWKLDSDDAGDRKTAAERLGALGSIRAIPKLIENFRRDSAASYSSEGREKELSTGAKALINLGAPAVPALMDALKHQDKEIRRRNVNHARGR